MTIKLKSKIIKRASVKKPAVKSVRAKTIPKSKQALIDIAKLKGYKVEWFDDRFYKLFLPLNIDPSFIKNIPDNFRYYNGESLEVFLPSVSTIKSNSEPRPYLERWRGDVGNDRADQISQQALDKGSNIHNAIDLVVNGTDIIYQNLKTKNFSDKEIKAYQKKRRRPVLVIHKQEEMIQIARYQRLVNILQPKILFSEQPVHCLEECYAGTLDQVWELPAGKYQINSDRKHIEFRSGLYIVDFKTGRGYDEASTFIQLSAYLNAHHLKEKITGAIGIHLNSDTKSGVEGVKVYMRYKEDLENYFEQFLVYKKVFFFSNPVFPKQYEFPNIITFKNKIKKGAGNA